MGLGLDFKFCLNLSFLSFLILRIQKRYGHSFVLLNSKIQIIIHRINSANPQIEAYRVDERRN